MPISSDTLMRGALVRPTRDVLIEDRPGPSPGAGEVLVRSSLIGICGSDTHALAGHHPFLDADYAPGHEAVGVVAAAGDSAFRVGDRVLLKPNVACGDCVNCRAERSNACETLSWIGCDTSRRWSGAMAEYFVAPAQNLFAVPDHVDDETAVLVECLATPVHAARIAGDLTGARVVVLGAGTIGALAVVAAVHAGAERVVVTDMEQSKLDRAVRIGASAGVLASADDADDRLRAALDGPADVVFDCVALEGSLRQAVGLVRRAGTVLVVGVPPRDASLPMPLIQDWEIRIQGCAAYTEADVAAALEIAAAGGVPTAEIVTGRVGLDDAAQAFAAASADSSGKVLIDVRG